MEAPRESPWLVHLAHSQESICLSVSVASSCIVSGNMVLTQGERVKENPSLPSVTLVSGQSKTKAILGKIFLTSLAPTKEETANMAKDTSSFSQGKKKCSYLGSATLNCTALVSLPLLGSISGLRGSLVMLSKTHCLAYFKLLITIGFLYIIHIHVH